MRTLFTKRPTGVRLPLLTALTMALLLVPTAMASAAEVEVHIEIEGTGSGAVIGVAPVGGAPEPIFCVKEGGKILEEGDPIPAYLLPAHEGQKFHCTAETQTEGALDGIKVERIAAPGSKWENPPGWSQEGGLAPGSCSPGATSCSVLNLGSEITIHAPFEAEAVMFALTLSTSGSGSGTFECKELPGGSPAPCTSGDEYPEGTEVEVIAKEDPGSEFVEFNNENGGECSGATCTVEMSAPRSVNAQFDEIPSFALTLSTSGSGSGTFECKELPGGSPAPCTSGDEYPEGTEVEVIAKEDPGSEFVEFNNENGGECSGATCTVEMSAPRSVNAQFDEIPSFALTLSTSGSGSGTFECKELPGGSPAPCTSGDEYPEGTEVEVIAKEDPGSEFVEFNNENGGECSGATCTVEMSVPRSVNAQFDEIPIATLTVVKNGGGEGTVESVSPDTAIDCGATCSSGYPIGESVTLKQQAEPGSVFAGWAGCTQINPGECAAEVASGGTQVTAIFIAVPVITEEPEGANCPEGGVKVEYAGETFYACNGEGGPEGEKGDQGEPGEDGEDGAPGAAGAQGPSGSDGAQGPKGDSGSQGQKGDTGAEGPQGPRGKRGPAGKVKVICKVRGKKVKCVVKAQNKRHHRHHRIGWRLMQGGHAVSHGRTGVRRLQHALNRAPSGRYVLRVAGQGGRRIHIG